MIRNKNIYVIVGSIGTGKSTVSRILKERGHLVIDADKVVHELYKNLEIQNILKKEFGENIISSGQVDRNILGEIVFNNEEKKKYLERIIHPIVMSKIFEIINKSEKETVFLEIPLYYKVEDIIMKNIEKYKIILINTQRDIQIKRLMKRNNINEEKAEKLVYNSKNIMNFEKKVDYIIGNNGDIYEINQQIENIIKMERLNEDS